MEVDDLEEEVVEAAKAAEVPVFKMEPWMWWLIAGAAAGLVLLIVIAVLERRRARNRGPVLRHAVPDDGAQSGAQRAAAGAPLDPARPPTRGRPRRRA
nr:hypothetical protein [Propionibacterium sp.]